MRNTLLTILMFALALYAWRNWFIPVCVLVVMDAVMKHDDMPRTLFGIQGANPWNLLLAAVLVPWLIQRVQERKSWDIPPGFAAIGVGYVSVIVVAFLRAVVQVASIHLGESGDLGFTMLGFTSDFLINPLKFIIVAFLLFDGARSRTNLLLGLGAIFAQAGLYAIQVIKNVPLGVLLTSSNPFRDRIQRECGLHANDLALVTVVAFWGLAACIPLWPYAKRRWRFAAVACSLVVLVALALTMSRSGYLAFAVVGLFFGITRWRPLLVLLPAAALVVCLAVPSIGTRLSEGFGKTDASGEEAQDVDAISGGRMTDLWPPALDEFSSSPLFGSGRLTILRSPLYDAILSRSGSVPWHPHNAYLEMLLDSGVVGLVVTLAFFGGIPLAVLFRGRFRQPLLSAAVGTGMAAAGTILIMGLTGQTFFPREGIFVVLCAYGLMMRAFVTATQLPAQLGLLRVSEQGGQQSRTRRVNGIS